MKGRFASLLLLLASGQVLGDGPPFAEIAEPVGEAWVQVQLNSYSAVWMKHTGDPSISFGLALLTQPVERPFGSPAEFAAWVRAQKGNNPDPERFETLRNDVAPGGDDRPTCVRYETVVLDKSPGGGEPLRLEIGGLACLHPDAPERYYDAQYSGRTPGSARLSQTLLREGWAFVNSLEFIAPESEEEAPPAETPRPVEREAA